MSVANLKSFYGKVEGDEALQQRMKAVAEKSKADHEAAVADLVQMGSDAGYQFTADHVNEARRAASGELTENELKNLSGGGEVGYSCSGTLMKDTCKYITWN